MSRFNSLGEFRSSLVAPFPWFGGKSRVADIVWKHFGDVPYYIEPFFGSGAVLLGRPQEHSSSKVEEVNDKDCYLANFWRAIRFDPKGVNKWADWPVNEADLHARNLWLTKNRALYRKKVMTRPNYYNTKVAGWWVWGLCAWIGAGWSSSTRHCRPSQSGFGQGVHAIQSTRTTFIELSNRLRNVRVLCGDWARQLPQLENRKQITGVFLDPPYSVNANRVDKIYSEDDTAIAFEVSKWAFSHGGNSQLRIALCGYDGEFKVPKDWISFSWSSTGGYNRIGSRANHDRHRERIWFSPHCLQTRLF